jgi:hypothetical protein
MKRRWFVVASVVLIPLLMSPKAKADGARVRWDIINLAPPNINAGGSASATGAGTYKITLTGSGTFGLGDDEGDVTGGGTWMTYSGATITGAGTYIVTGLIKFVEAPGTLVGLPLVDHIGSLATTHAGLAYLRIAYNDGSKGVLTVSCTLLGTPPQVYEGITASKDYVLYSNHPAGVDGSNLFHITPSTEDQQ